MDQRTEWVKMLAISKLISRIYKKFLHTQEKREQEKNEQKI